MNKQQKWQRIGTLASLMVVFAMLLSFVNTDAAANWSPDLKKGKPNKGLSPMEFFGYNIGDDYQLTPWTTREMDGVGLRKGVVEYFYHLEKYTNRVRIFPIGTSEDGSPQIIAVFATPPTWARIDYYKEINRKLADPRLIGSDAEALALAKAGKPVYWLNAGIHASERTGIETEVQMAFELAAGKDDRVNEILDNLIVIIEGTNNPDGEKLVTDWYYKYLGTPYTNSSPPCYHKYICHDTNRDFVGLSVQELANSALARFEWNPVAYQDMHQTRDLHYLGMPADPVNYNYGSLSSAEMLGLNGFVITEMIADGYKGVFTYDYADMWNPMYNHMYTVMHNGIGGWWELTGVSMASPRTINAGLNNGHRTWFNPEPYFAPFEYHLIDAVNMQKDSHMYGLLYAARHRVEFLYNFYMTAKMKMAQATSTAPYAFVVPANGGDNHDVIDLINTLVWAQHIEVFKATADFSVDGQMFLAGDYIVPLNQPYGLYAKLLLTRQDFPIQEVVNPYLCRGDACATYDHQAWTMGLLGDVAVVGLNTPLPALAWEPVVGIQPYAGVLMGGVSSDYVIEHASNNGLAVVLPLLWQNANYGVSQVDAAFVAAGMNFPAGTFLVHTTGSQSDHDYFKALVEQEGLKSYAIGAGEVPGGAVPLAQPKIGMLKPNSSTMPEGWLNIRLDRSGIPHDVILPSQIANGEIMDYDVIIIPSLSMNNLLVGPTSASTPPEWRGGIGDSGAANLKAWTEAGGTLLLMGNSTLLPVEKVWNVGVTRGLNDPISKGSILAIKVDPTTKLGYGYNEDESAWYLAGSSTPFFDVDPASGAKVAAWFPTASPVLQSGYINDETPLLGKAVMVETKLGSGNLFLISPDVTYRAIARGQYMFFWNAIFAGAR